MKYYWKKKHFNILKKTILIFIMHILFLAEGTMLIILKIIFGYRKIKEGSNFIPR